MGYSNLELNSFLTNLMDGWDEAAAQAVVDAFHTLPISNDVVETRTEIKEGAPMMGHTNEVGNITIDDKEVKETTKGETQEGVARVGYYKVKQIRSCGRDFWLPGVIFGHQMPLQVALIKPHLLSLE